MLRRALVACSMVTVFGLTGCTYLYHFVVRAVEGDRGSVTIVEAEAQASDGDEPAESAQGSGWVDEGGDGDEAPPADREPTPTATPTAPSR